MKLMCLIVISLLLIITSCKEDSVEPQLYGNIEGKVLDSKSNSPIEGVSISTNPPTSAVLSAEDGSFEIENIPIGNYSISAKKYGYAKENVGVSITDNKTTDAMIFMGESSSYNNAPGEPVNPTPTNSESELPTSLSLKWTAYDEDEGDSLSFDVYLYESNSTQRIQVAEGISDSSCFVEDLSYGTTYFWFVVATDPDAAETRSDIWSFTTETQPINPILISYKQKESSGLDIFSMDESGSTLVKLKSVNGDELWPRYSPNKRSIAYSAKNGSGSNIYIMDCNGGSEYKISNLPVAGYHNSGYGFCWSKDGGEIIFAHYDKLYSVNTDGSSLTEIVSAPDDRHFRECDYSPIEDKIVVLTIGSKVYNAEIYLVDKNNGTMELLVDNQKGITERPSFSVGGDQVMYTHDLGNAEFLDGRQLDSHIFIIDLSTKEVKDISAHKVNGTIDTNPKFSANGAKIIFNNSSNVLGAKPVLWTMDIDGSDRTPVIDNAIMPDWK